jgi:hypothetical protein
VDHGCPWSLDTGRAEVSNGGPTHLIGESKVVMSPRYVVAIAGGVIALLGIVFELIAVTNFASTVLLLGVALLAWGLRSELWRVTRIAAREGGKFAARMNTAWRARRERRAAEAVSVASVQAKATAVKKQRQPSSTHWPGSGDFGFEVVGESNYQPALAAAAGNQQTRYEGLACVAQLVPEDNNRYDKSAVAVSVNGSTVGYLSRDDARSFRRRLGSKGLTGVVTTCGAVIRGGGQKSDGTRMFYGIWLDIQPFG